ncbi:DNA 3'-5' helicase [Mycobacterium senriense]
MYFDRLMELLGIDYRALIELADQWDAFFESSQVRIDRLARDGAPFAADIEFFRRVFRERTGITVSTVHGVKGLEYDTVIAYGLLQDILPHFADPAPWESANKLLYVLASRARKNLHLIAERNRPHGRGRVYHATSPLQDLLFDYDVI